MSAQAATQGTPATPAVGGVPARAGLVLVALIAVAGVANLNLAVANVALPSIDKAFGASQTALDLVAVGFSLGLAASVLWLGALGDRYGRKLLLLGGMALSVPASLVAGFAPSIEVLILARIVGGVAAGMAFPTTLALITALWAPGAGQTRAIALWSGIGGAVSCIGPVVSGFLLEHFAWGSVFLVTAPLAAIALVLAWVLVPAHVNETTDRVDNVGGILSVVLVGSMVLAINFAPVPHGLVPAAGLGLVAVAALVGFVIRQRRAANPLYDLDVASRRVFWVAAVAGIIVFGSLMGSMFIGQQFMQNVLGYSTLDAGLAILPNALMMIVCAPISARLVESRGSRLTLLAGYLFCFLGILSMLLWAEGTPYAFVGFTYALIGIGVGLGGTPASRSLTNSVPVRRAGMASGTADLQRDLGGAVMQSIFGALLTAGYAAAIAASVAASPDASEVTAQTQSALQLSYASAAEMAARFPQYADAIIGAAKTAFIDGANLAYLAGCIFIVGGAVLVWFMFPKRDRERELIAEYRAQDATGTGPGRSAPAPAPAAPGI
jgi:MFS transporter, DHA2 family, multidrug resistance protein